MPTYCFKDPEGRIHEEVFHMDEVPKTIKTEDGVVCKRSISAEIRAQGKATNAYPRKSYAMAVPAWQAKELTEKSKEAGIPTTHDERGRPELRTEKHRKEYAEWRGFTDFNGGYNDPDCRGHRSERKGKPYIPDFRKNKPTLKNRRAQNGRQ